MGKMQALSAIGDLRVLLTDTPNSPRHAQRLSEMDQMLADTAVLVGTSERICENFSPRLRHISADIKGHKIDRAYDGVLRLYAAMEVVADPARYSRTYQRAA